MAILSDESEFLNQFVALEAIETHLANEKQRVIRQNPDAGNIQALIRLLADRWVVRRTDAPAMAIG